jgi:uncharacterized protein (TIGR03000 family)
MLRNVLSVSLSLLLTGAGLDLTAGAAQAAPHGGGHISGGFHGGSHFGGFHGSHLGGFHGGYHPGYHSGYNHFLFPRDHALRGLHGYRYPRYHDYRGYRHQWWYPGYYGSYGAWPDYDSSYPMYSSDTGPGYWDDAADEPGQDYVQEPGIDAGAASAQRDGPAEVTMILPADATLWAMGKKMHGTSPRREFTTPTLKAGHRYAYDFRARWKENGRTVTQTQKVTVTPGAHVEVHFPVQSTKGHPAPNR